MCSILVSITSRVLGRQSWQHLAALLLICCTFLVAPQSSSSAPPENSFVYKEPKPLRGDDIIALKLRAKDFSAYYGIQFGPGPEDVLYLILDCKEEYARYDILQVYVPGHSKYGRPASLRGSKKSKGVAFRKIELRTCFSQISVEYSILAWSTAQWDKSRIDLDLEITCRVKDAATGDKATFVLSGDVSPIINAFAQIPVSPVIGVPSLKVSWDHRSDPPHVRWKVKMGDYALVPDAGFNPKAEVVISTKDGKVKMRKRIKVKSSEKTEFTYKPDRELRPSTPYHASVTMDLEPFWPVLKSNAVGMLRN